MLLVCLLSADLNYAYISGLRSIRRYSLPGDDAVDIAIGLTNPRYLTWADKAQSAMFVTQDQPNRVTIVDAFPVMENGRQVIKDVGVSPMSVACIDAAHLLVCCNNEIYMGDLMENIPMPAGLFKGIGRVLLNFINKEGKADTRKPVDPITKKPIYPYLFENVPFGGYLSLNINHSRAREKYAYYRVKVDDEIRYDTWSDIKFNKATGKYDIRVEFSPIEKGGETGLYRVHEQDDMGNSDLAMVLNSANLLNKKQTIKIEFADKNGKIVEGASESMEVLIDNNHCSAKIEMPGVDGVSATLDCGMLKYTNKNQKVVIAYNASHPNLFAIYKWRLGKGGKGAIPANGCSVDGEASLAQFKFENEVGSLLEDCTVAAFYAHVYVYAKATNGDYRQSQYDASYAISFALTPEKK